MFLSVTVMEWKHSLTPQAMIFSISPRKPWCLQFFITGQSNIILRAEIGLLMNLCHKILQTLDLEPNNKDQLVFIQSKGQYYWEMEKIINQHL